MTAQRFDREFTLAELLGGMPAEKIETALNKTIGPHWCLVDAEGTMVSGATVSAAEAVTVSLRVEFEPLGQLQATGAMREHVEAAAAWLEMLLAGVYRYRMAADLHLEAVNADFEALQRKHDALQQSEARYRELNAELDQRVKEQVEVIERTQRRLYQSEKMAAIGTLAAGMAHEINNPIGFIRSNLVTASTYVDKIRQVMDAVRRGDMDEAMAHWKKLDIDFILEDVNGLFSESVSGADRIARIVANLKAFSSIDIAEAAPSDLNDCVLAVAGIVKDQLPQNVTLEVDTQPLPRIVCDQSRMNQVLFALVQNARQACANGGRIRITSRVADDEIRISVMDNGHGIAPEIMNRIFDPFFTTRGVGKGMGLGLTVSKDVVAAHQGRIDVKSKVGAGSIFTLCLPVHELAERPEQT